MKLPKYWKIKQFIHKFLSKVITIILGVSISYLGYFLIYRTDVIVKYKNDLYKKYFSENFEVNINKLYLINKDDIEKFIEDEYKKNIFIDIISLQKKLLNAFPFIKKLRIKKSFPNKYYVDITEFKVTGILSDNLANKYYILDTEKLLPFIPHAKLNENSIVHYIGDGAIENLHYIHNYINKFNAKYEARKVTMAIFISNRRWNIVIPPVTVKFPSGSLEEIWQSFEKVWLELDLKNTSINTLDFRIKGKLFIGKNSNK